MTKTILLIEDNKVAATQYLEFLEEAEYRTCWARNGKEGLRLFKQKPVAAVITDLKLPDMEGISLIEQMHAEAPDIPVILVSAYMTSRAMISAIRAGAYDYLEKPVESRHLLDILGLALEGRASGRRRPDATTETLDRLLIGRSPAMRAVYKEIGRLAATPVTVLIVGETGTGKELVARALHENSSRSAKPFVPINVAAIPDTLLESELFGHERGAFTGAHRARKGRFEEADGGTLFLDEIGEMPPPMQAKLLRVVEEHQIERLGGNRAWPIDVRLVAATHRDLETMVRQKQFRADLYHRLAVATVALPPLRARREDIPMLAVHFFRLHAAEYGFNPPPLESDVLAYLEQQPWPGNVRELENTIRKTLVRARGQGITLNCLKDVEAVQHRAAAPPAAAVPPAKTILPPPAAPADVDEGLYAWLAKAVASATRRGASDLRAEILDQIDETLIKMALEQCHGNRSRAAALIGINRYTLRQKMTAYGLVCNGGVTKLAPGRQMKANIMHHEDSRRATG